VNVVVACMRAAAPHESSEVVLRAGSFGSAKVMLRREVAAPRARNLAARG
jgi:hypothetical protein